MMAEASKHTPQQPRHNKKHETVGATSEMGSATTISSSDLLLAIGFHREDDEVDDDDGNACASASAVVPNNDTWLITDPPSSGAFNNSSSTNASNTSTNTTTTTTTVRRGIIVSSSEKRDEFVRSMTTKNKDAFPNGYTMKRITTMEELRDTLLTLMPIDTSSPLSQVQQQPQVQHKLQQPQGDDHKYYPEGLDEVKRFEMFLGVISHEDDLLNQRVSWIILAQSFLMAAFVTSTGADSLRYVTACVGLATVVVTMPAIVAAGRNIERQQQVYFTMLQSDERSQQLHGHARDLTVKDAEEHYMRKKYGHTFPNMAFRGYTSIKILHTVLALAFVQFFGWCFLLIALLFDW